MHLHDMGHAHDAGYWREIADEIEIEFVVKRRVDSIRRGNHEERVAVRRRIHDRLGADVAAGPGPVLDDELLAKPLGKPLTDQARHDVGTPASGETNDYAHRPRWVGLRPSEARHRRQRGSARSHMQELSKVRK